MPLKVKDEARQARGNIEKEDRFEVVEVASELAAQQADDTLRRVVQKCHSSLEVTARQEQRRRHFACDDGQMMAASVKTDGTDLNSTRRSRFSKLEQFR